MPQAFIDLVEDSLADLTSHVRTPFGRSRTFKLGRSLRQGDPLAPLLFVCFIDTLHTGLAEQCEDDGYVFRCTDGDTVTITSKGFADDTWIVSRSLCRMHAWVVRG